MHSALIRVTALVLALAPAAWAGPPSYTMIDLGRLAGDAYALGLNNLDQVVGWSFNTSYFGRAFLWQNGAMQELANPGGLRTFATAINDSGVIAGYWETNPSPQNMSAARWVGGAVENLGAAGWNQAWAINAQGTIAGSQGSHPVVWRNGVMVDLGSVGSFGVARDINDNEVVVGEAGVSSGSLPFVYSGSAVTFLPMAPGFAYTAMGGVNNAGQVVATLSYGNTQAHQAFTWSADGALSELPMPPGAITSGAYGINNSGQIIGSYGNGSSDWPALWYDGVAYDMNSLVTGGSVSITRLMAINDRGDIAAYGGSPYSVHALLLVVPEPATLALLAGGALAVRRRRRHFSS